MCDTLEQFQEDSLLVAGVVAFTALGGIGGDPAALWIIAERAGYTLEAFVAEVMSLTAPCYEPINEGVRARTVAECCPAATPAQFEESS